MLLKGVIDGLSKAEIFEQNTEVVEKYKAKAVEQLERYILDRNILHDSEKELRKVAVIVVARKFVQYYFVE